MHAIPPVRSRHRLRRALARHAGRLSRKLGNVRQVKLGHGMIWRRARMLWPA